MPQTRNIADLLRGNLARACLAQVLTHIVDDEHAAVLCGGRSIFLVPFQAGAPWTVVPCADLRAIVSIRLLGGPVVVQLFIAFGVGGGLLVLAML